MRRWSPEDYGAAMVRCAQERAGHITPTKDGIRCRAWYRGGDDDNLCISVSKGLFFDQKTRQSGNAKAFAELLSMSLKQFMGRYGPVELDDDIAYDAPPEPVWKPGQAAELYGAAVTATRPDSPATIWLRETRGLGEGVELVNASFAAVDENTGSFLDEGLWPSGQGEWAGNKLATQGPALVSPLRSVASEQVAAIALRFIAGEIKGLVPPGTKLADPDTGHPRGYGLAHRCRGTRCVILVEGQIDTLAAESFVIDIDGVVAVGAHSASQIVPWARALVDATPGHVVLVPDLGKEAMASGVGAEETAKAYIILQRASVASTIFSWTRFFAGLRERGVIEPGKVVRDIADALKVASWSLVRDAFLAALPDEVGR